MDSEIGRITSKGQTTIPAALRRELNLAAGDEVIFRKEGNAILMQKATPLDVEYYRAVQASFASEWNSSEDNEAFRDL